MFISVSSGIGGSAARELLYIALIHIVLKHSFTIMFLIYLFSFISLTLINVATQDVDIMFNVLDGTNSPIQNLKADVLLMQDKIQLLQEEKVNIQLYYECLCPDCRVFDTMELKPTVEKLSSYLNLNLYPYGNAHTIDKGNGHYEFKCQHGPEECYGNKLHACAMDYLGNMTKAVFFNSCMMESSQNKRGSDDEAADECGKLWNINSEPIKQCAKGSKGTQLLKYYGDESRKVDYKYVPYLLINGIQNDGKNFTKAVCAAFAVPPPACQQ